MSDDPTRSGVFKRMAALLRENNQFPAYARLGREEVRTVCQFVARDHNGNFTAALGKLGLLPALNLLNQQMGSHWVRLHPDHEDDGLAWLWANRKNMQATAVIPFGTYERNVLRCVDYLTFSGVATRYSGGSVLLVAPIYTVHAKRTEFENGTFSYEAWSWQSGVKPRIV